MPNYRDEEITIFTRKDLNDALKLQYGTIKVKGEIAEKVLKDLNKDKKLGKGISGIAIVIGIFSWPILVAGLAGALISKDDFKKYKSTINGDTIVLTRK